jgi:hypothetical protein
MSAIPFVKRINWRHILAHFFAVWFISHGALFLSYLTDIGLIEPQGFRDYSTMAWTDEDMSARRIKFLMNVGYFVAWGRVGGFIISLVVSIVRKWFWINSVIAFVALLGITRLYDIDHHSFVGQLIQLPGRVFESPFLAALANGIIFITAGLLLLFSKPANQFIRGNQLLSDTAIS